MSITCITWTCPCCYHAHEWWWHNRELTIADNGKPMSFVCSGCGEEHALRLPKPKRAWVFNVSEKDFVDPKKKEKTQNTPTEVIVSALKKLGVTRDDVIRIMNRIEEEEKE